MELKARYAFSYALNDGCVSLLPKRARLHFRKIASSLLAVIKANAPNSPDRGFSGEVQCRPRRVVFSEAESPQLEVKASQAEKDCTEK